MTGYFTATGDGGRAGCPLAPARVLDSRLGLGRDGAFKADTPGSVHRRRQGRDRRRRRGPDRQPDGHRPDPHGLRLADPDARRAAPTTSTINFPTGEARANGITSRVDAATGKVSLVYKAGDGATTHLLLDVTGYYH